MCLGNLSVEILLFQIIHFYHKTINLHIILYDFIRFSNQLFWVTFLYFFVPFVLYPRFQSIVICNEVMYCKLPQGKPTLAIDIKK